VFGHGSEQWINDAKLVDPVSKALFDHLIGDGE
jgi:hypothetical protein